MLDHLVPPGGGAIPVTPVTQGGARSAPCGARRGVRALGRGHPIRRRARAKSLLVPDETGRLGRVLVGMAEGESCGRSAACPDALARGQLCPRRRRRTRGRDALALGWALGSYAFTRYKKRERGSARLEWPQGADRARVEAVAEGFSLARDLINTPAEDMGPAELAGAVEDMAARARRALPRHRRRRAAGRELSDDPRRRPRQHARAAAGRSRLGRRARAQADAGRQGRVLRQRRARPQAGGGHAADEEGHGRRRDADRPGARGHGAEAAGAAARCWCRRSRIRSPATPSARSTSSARARASPSRSATPMPRAGSSCAMRWPRPRARAPALLVDMATLTGAARVALGPELPALFANDDALAAELLARGRGRARSAVAPAAVAALSRDAEEPGRRHQQRLGGGFRRRHHRGALSRRVRARRRCPGRISTPTPGTRRPGPAGPRAARRWACARSWRWSSAVSAGPGG